MTCTGGVDGTRVNIWIWGFLVKYISVDWIRIFGEELSRMNVRSEKVGFRKKLKR